MSNKETFSIYELHYLIGAFDGELMPGLPTLDDIVTTSELVWTIAKEALEKKGLVNEDGSLTKSGFVIVETLREYCLGTALIILNNFYFMQCRDSNFSILIIDTGQGYQLAKISPMSRLLLLQDKLSLVTRIPLEDEVDFLTERRQLTSAIETALASDKALMIQYYPLEQMCETRHAALLTASYLFVEEGGELLGFDVNQEELYRFSQYYFLERLYSWLAIPFREEDFENGSN
mgnify:FL=1